MTGPAAPANPRAEPGSGRAAAATRDVIIPEPCRAVFWNPTGNRLVADTLEADWNAALRELAEAQDTNERAHEQQNRQLTDTQRARIAQLVTDVPAIWNDPATPQRERKRIVRLLLTDVTVHRDGDTITAHVRFPAGQHTTLAIPAPLPAGEQRRTSAEFLAAIDELLDQHTSGQIAQILNQRQMTTGTHEAYHRLIVDNIIRAYRLRTRRQRLRATGLLTLVEIAQALDVSPNTIKSWRRAGIVRAHRYNDKGEHLYERPDPDNPPDRPKIGRPARH
jgi:hypothetical protein